MTEAFRTSDGRVLSYRREGSGPLLVCHPGGPGYSSRCLGDLGGLGERLELVLLDPRGSENSDPARTPDGYRIDDYAADVDELRIHLGAGRIDLFGHSHGGVVAMAYAAEHPEHVGRLVLASSGPRFAAQQTEATQAAIDRRRGEPWFEDARTALEQEEAGAWDSPEELGRLLLRAFPLYFARYGDPERAYIRSLDGEIPSSDALQQWEAEIFASFDLRPQLRRIDAPTLVITGEEDFVTGPVCAQEIAEGIEGAQVVILPGTGHVIFVEARERFRDEVWRFLGVA